MLQVTSDRLGKVPAKTDIKQVVAVSWSMLTSAAPESAAAMSNHFAANPRLPHALARFGPVPETVAVVLLVTGTPLERHTTQGEEKPPSPPSKPQSLTALTLMVEKFVSVM